MADQAYRDLTRALNNIEAIAAAVKQLRRHTHPECSTAALMPDLRHAAEELIQAAHDMEIE